MNLHELDEKLTQLYRLSGPLGDPERAVALKQEILGAFAAATALPPGADAFPGFLLAAHMKAVARLLLAAGEAVGYLEGDDPNGAGSASVQEPLAAAVAECRSSLLPAAVPWACNVTLLLDALEGAEPALRAAVEHLPGRIQDEDACLWAFTDTRAKEPVRLTVKHATDILTALTACRASPVARAEDDPGMLRGIRLLVAVRKAEPGLRLAAKFFEDEKKEDRAFLWAEHLGPDVRAPAEERLCCVPIRRVRDILSALNAIPRPVNACRNCGGDGLLLCPACRGSGEDQPPPELRYCAVEMESLTDAVPDTCLPLPAGEPCNGEKIDPLPANPGDPCLRERCAVADEFGCDPGCPRTGRPVRGGSAGGAVPPVKACATCERLRALGRALANAGREALGAFPFTTNLDEWVRALAAWDKDKEAGQPKPYPVRGVCPECKGEPDPPKRPDLEPCPACGGSGMVGPVMCSEFNCTNVATTVKRSRTGKKWVPVCAVCADSNPCSHCAGLGWIGAEGRTCTNCNGRGRVPEPLPPVAGEKGSR